MAAKFFRFTLLTLVVGSSAFINSPAWSADGSADTNSIAERIHPVGKNCIEGKPCKAAEQNTAAASAAPAQPAASTAPRSGQEIVQQVCAGCHTAGVMGAPKIGNKADWAPRIAQGMDTLVSHAINGFNNKMPPKGTCSTCSDADIKAAIKYMTDQSR